MDGKVYLKPNMKAAQQW